jgi:hypothetical protein
MFMGTEPVTTHNVGVVARNLRRPFYWGKSVNPLRALRIIFGLLVLASFAHAQDGFFSSWEDRTRSTLAAQPAWPTPVVTANAGLVQLFRTDFFRQIMPTEITSWNYGNSKGVDLIPWYRTEFDITVPPYIQRNSPKVEDGFGDISMLLKYRILSDGEARAYSMSFSAGGTIRLETITTEAPREVSRLPSMAERASKDSMCNRVRAKLYPRGTPPNWDDR